MMNREARLEQLIAVAEASIRTRVGQIEAALKPFNAGSYYRIEKAADDLKLTANELQNALKSSLSALSGSQEQSAGLV